jgi:putative ABC transport system substrate-binding protein
MESNRPPIGSTERSAIVTTLKPSNHPYLNGAWTPLYEEVDAIDLDVIEGGIPADLEPAIGALAQEKAQAMLTLPDSVFAAQTRLVAQVALKHRLPTAGNRYQFPEAGGLFSYGMNATNNWRLGAKFVHRILQGAKPGELPFEQPTTFELVINTGTAKTLGLKVPQAMLLQATRVIE